jgi:MFS family permease
MIATLLSLTALFTTVLLMLLGNGLLGSLLGLKLAQAGHGPLVTGLVMTGYYAGLVTGAMLCARIIRQVGHIRAFAAFCATNIAMTLLLTFTDSAGAWALLRFMTGMSMMGAYMVIESWLNERAEASMRGRVFSIYMLISYTGLGGSQFLLAFNKHGSQTLFILSTLLFALCMLPVVLTRAVVPKPMQRVRFDIRNLFRLAPHAIYGCLAAGLTNGAFYALGPVYAFAHGKSSSLVGLFMGLTIFGGLLLQWPLGLLSDRFKRRLIMEVLGVTMAITSLLVLIVDTATVVQLAVVTLWGGLAFTIYPVAVAYANDRIMPEELVPAAGALLMAYSGGAAIGPILAGLVMRGTGTGGLYLFTALTGFTLALFVARRRGAEKVAVEDQGNYVAVPRTSAVIAQLDPRAGTEADAVLDDKPPPVNHI